MAVEAFRSRIGSALANRDFTEAEAAWRECASLHPEEQEYLLGAAQQLSRHDRGALAGDLCLALAQAQHERGDHSAALTAARAALRANQKTEGLREFFVKLYGKIHESNPHFAEFLAKSGLETDAACSLKQQAENLDRYLVFAEGTHVYHPGGWEYGVVAEFDAAEEAMVVDFQRKKNHRISILSATKILQRLDPEHIGVYKHYRRAELMKLIEEDPARVFRIYLASRGGSATLKQAREEFVPEILAKEQWSRWWGRAKKALLQDPKIRIGKGSSPLIELRVKAKTIEDEVKDRMRAAPDALRRCSTAREYLRTLDLTDALRDAVGEVLDESLAKSTATTPGRLAMLYLKSDLKGPGAEEARAEARAIPATVEKIVPFLVPLEPADRKRAVEDLVETGSGDWTERANALLRSGDPEILEALYGHLRKRRPDLLIAFFTELSAQPHAAPSAFLWYVRGYLAGDIPPELAPAERDTTAMEKLLTLANQIGLEQKRSGDADLKEFLRQLRAFLTSRRMKSFRAFAENKPADYCLFLLTKIQRNRGFTDQAKQALVDVLEDIHPNLTQPAAAPAARAGDVVPRDDVIWTTMAGYRKKESELRYLVDVEVPANAEDLGRAASFGDISENAEYTAALEKQDFLMRRVGELRDALEKASILNAADVSTERVVIGTRVELRNVSRNRDEAFSILGPWDVDLSKGIISYLSPVGRGLLGKVRGTTAQIELPDEGKVDYEILSIGPDPTLAAE